jgi:hypothetical protein
MIGMCAGTGACSRWSVIGVLLKEVVTSMPM